MKGAVINSHTKNEYLENEKFWPILEAAEALNAPIYLHPRDPAAGMYDLADYGGLQMIWGFAADASLHALRLILSGAFDRFPTLQFVLGHLGEGIPFALDRIDNRFAAIPAHYRANLPRKIKRRPSEYFRDNFTVTSSGQNWEPAVRFCQQVLGADRVMFGADYPFEDQTAAVKSVNEIAMEGRVRDKFFHANAERVFGLKMS
jgi:2,3-dihydroxybenzoate decarboxylase